MILIKLNTWLCSSEKLEASSFQYKMDLIDNNEEIVNLCKENEDGSTVETWVKMGKLHRIDGPAKIITIESSKTLYWFKYGQLHRDNAPAIMKFNNHILVFAEWYSHGKLQGSSDIFQPENFNFQLRIAQLEDSLESLNTIVRTLYQEYMYSTRQF